MSAYNLRSLPTLQLCGIVDCARQGTPEFEQATKELDLRRCTTAGRDAIERYARWTR